MPMNEKKELFTIGTREDLKHLEDRGFEEMYEELEAIGGELGDSFDSMIFAQYGRVADNNENVKDVSSSYRTYTEYYKEYIGRFGRMAVGQVVFDGVDLQLFLNRAQSLPQINWNRTNGQLRMMQCFGIMTEVARFVNQLYLSFVKLMGTRTLFLLFFEVPHAYVLAWLTNIISSPSSSSLTDEI